MLCSLIHQTRNDIKVSKLKEISSVSENYFHQLWLKLQSKKSKSIVICISYRPPECPLSCLETNLKPSFVQALLLNKPIFILGDLNCNVMKDCPENTALGNFMLEMNLNQLITTPTRITDKSESLIDVIITSTSHLVNESGVMNTIISDHLPVYAVLNMKLPKPSSQYMLTRSYKDYDVEKFTAHLSLRSEELISIFTESNVNSKLDKFNDVLLTTLAVHAPVRITKIHNRPCPFVTLDIINQMSHRDQLHRRYKRTRDIDDWKAFKNVQRSVKTTLKDAEKQHVQTEVILHKDNSRSLWKVINRCIPSKDKRNLTYHRNSLEVANDFNQFFQSVGKRAAETAEVLALQNNLNISTESVLQNRRSEPSSAELFKFTPVTCTELQRIITSMPSNKSPGPDKISMQVIKDCLPVILGPLTDIINTSFTTSMFPESWKIAKIIPLLKDGDHEVAANNRPLSMLNVLSKICEKVALKQFSGFLNRTDRLSPHQSGNKKFHSTETLSILVNDVLLKSMDSKKITALVLLDLSKAFDSVDHSILLKKLSNIGVSEEALNWFESYISNRKQFVCIGTSVSEVLPITHGVPQGAILSPLLFCIYINDLPKVPQTSELESFVDDSKIFMSFPIEDFASAKTRIEEDLNLVTTWFFENKLLINPEKTKLLLIGTRQLLGNLPEDMTITFLGEAIAPIKNAKDLGVTLDSYLTYDYHIKNVVSSCMGKLCQINRVKDCFDSDTLRLIINALVMSKLYYCSVVWSNTSATNIKKLRTVQNFACRILTNAGRYDHVTPALRTIYWLPVEEHLKYREALITYKCMNGLAPPYLSELFMKRNEIHDLNTRNNKALHIPQYKAVSGQRTFYYRAVKLWNDLDEDLKKLPWKRFKIELKRKMLNNS